MSGKVEIGKNSKVNIKWQVMSVDYSHEKANEIITTFAKKYGISKDNVKIEPIFVQKNENGEDVTLADNIIDDIQNPEFQHELFKTFIALNGIENVDFEKILAIDSAINNRINYESYDKHKRYMIKWIKWSNFMSYGKNNFFDFQDLRGLVLLTSNPANQGGKSTFCLDLIRFLLFGKVTSREDDWTLAKVFNKHLPEETECLVEGCVQIDGVDYIIRRVVTRPKLEKRTDKSKTTQKVYYYKLINDEYIDLEDEENQGEANGRDTNKVIKDAIGNEKDFDLMICVDRRNLEGLISLKDTERGRLISRWIGLLPLEEKDKIARETFNQEVNPRLLTNKYNREELKGAVEEFAKENEELEKKIKELKLKEAECNKKISEYKATRDTLLQSKIQIDESLMKVDVATVQAMIDRIIEEGKIKRAEKSENERKLAEIGKIEFDEEEYRALEQSVTDLNVEIATMREQAKALKNSIETLKRGEYCPTCGAKLKNVDNTESIKNKTEEFEALKAKGVAKAEELKGKTAEKEKLAKLRETYHQMLRLQLIVEKNSVDLQNIKARYRENKRLMKDIETNKSAIENNNRIEISLRNIDLNIANEQKRLDLILEQINEKKNGILYNNKKTSEFNQIIEVINSEETTIRMWKLYLEMVGKNGISKLVIRKALPFINGELKRILNDVCDFEVEVAIDDRNDVEFYIIHDGVKMSLGSGSGFEQTVSSIALRSVLSRISTFSKPSFVVFDEILGGVADDNYDKIRLLYNKIVKDYSLILEISHLKNIYEWHDKVITVTKENNISRLEML